MESEDEMKKKINKNVKKILMVERTTYIVMNAACA